VKSALENAVSCTWRDGIAVPSSFDTVNAKSEASITPNTKLTSAIETIPPRFELMVQSAGERHLAEITGSKTDTNMEVFRGPAVNSSL
jgi:hypothetical protein